MTTTVQLTPTTSPLRGRVMLVLVVAWLLAASPALATPFKLTPLNLGNGYSISGKVWTDGTTGALAKKNVKGWGITLSQTALVNRYTTADTITASGASSNGKTLTADFLSLIAADTTTTLTANVRRAGGKVYTIVPTDFGNGLFVSGTITTDGATGPLSAENLTRWNIVVKEITRTTFTKKNSRLTSLRGVSTDNLSLGVSRDGGRLGFTAVQDGGRKASILLASFVYPNMPDGGAGYRAPHTQQFLSPLGGAPGEEYLVGTALLPLQPQSTPAANQPRQPVPAPVPEPTTMLLLGTGLVGLAGMRSRRRRSA